MHDTFAGRGMLQTDGTWTLKPTGRPRHQVPVLSAPTSTDLTHNLPAARRVSCHGMTADGQRHQFASIEALLRWSMRTAAVEALCLDNCVWRSFSAFRRNLALGMPVNMAFENADVHNWGAQAEVTARKSRVQRAA